MKIQKIIILVSMGMSSFISCAKTNPQQSNMKINKIFSTMISKKLLQPNQYMSRFARRNAMANRLR